jgi:putative restriction endonuclease
MQHMGYGVLIHRSDSIYEDSPAEHYQFPNQYLGRIQSCVGDWIIYYEPRKVADTRGYFAVAKIERVIPDPKAPGMYLALIEPGSYLDFANPVPFSGASGVVEARCAERARTNLRSRSICRSFDLTKRFQSYCHLGPE